MWTAWFPKMALMAGICTVDADDALSFTARTTSRLRIVILLSYLQLFDRLGLGAVLTALRLIWETQPRERASCWTGEGEAQR
ncbi:hypothetical protein M758_8G061100 [Ceratodon purpureus]|nr:hypothetical protein M758_8G061100 [Ceratodon purpureus]